MPFNCEICDTVVRDKKALKEHQKSHSSEQFICDKCGNAYGKQKNLNQHVRSKHSNVFFECAHCEFKCGRKFVLQRHIQAHHAPPGTIKKPKPKEKKVQSVQKYVKKENLLLAQKFECTQCEKTFTLKRNLHRHVTFHHGDNIKDHLHACMYCSKGFRDRNNLKKHIKMCGTKFQENYSTKEQIFTCLMPGCETVLHNQHVMLEHYKRVHDVVLEYESLEFDSKQKFDEWRIDLQRSTACQFSVSRVWKNTASSNWRMQCHRTGMQPAEKENRQRFHKLSGSKKLNGFCPAEIVLKERKSDRIWHATIQKTHVGHCNNSHEELKFLSLNKKKKSDIGSKLSQGTPLNTILLNSQRSTTDQEMEWNETINYDDLANVATALGLDTKLPAPFTDDLQNIRSFVAEHKQSVLFYKEENSEDTEFGVLKKKDFALVFMSPFQESLLKKFSYNLIMYNVTHKTNPSEFLLHSIMVLDEDSTGIAVAFLLSNRNDETVLELFLHSIKMRMGILTPLTVITDMQDSFHNAFEVVMQAPRFSLWYLWHIYEEWRLSLKKIQSFEKKKCVIMTLYELSEITNVQMFLTKLEIFINNTDPELQLFIEYFKTKYSMNATYWADCYRVGAKVNMNNESFHSFLKGKIYGKKKIKTVYECLRCIETYVSVKENCKIMKTVKPERMQKIRILRTRHHTAVKNEGLYTIHSFPVSENECTHTWLISLSEKEEKERKKKTVKENDDSEGSNDEELNDGEPKKEENSLQLYIVQRRIDFKKPEVPYLECSICKIALEEYSCTCIDYLIKFNICKHIHAVAMHCKKNGYQCTCESHCGPIIVGTIVVDVDNMEIVTSNDENDDDDEGFSNVNPIEDTCDEEDSVENLQDQLIQKINSISDEVEDPCDEEDSVENLQDQLIQRINSISDEETLKNVLEYITSTDRPIPIKKRSRQRRAFSSSDDFS